MSKKYFTIGLVILWPFLAHAQNEEDKDWWWADWRLGISSFEVKYNIGVSANYSRGHHLFSIDAFTYFDEFPSGEFSICGDPISILMSGGFQYGYIKKYADAFWYGKAGLSFVHYEKLLSVEPTFFCDDGTYKVRNLPGIPIEAGFALKHKFIMVQPYISLLVIMDTPPMVNAGLKLGFGNLK